jgi:enoyl-CoA hydratase
MAKFARVLCGNERLLGMTVRLRPALNSIGLDNYGRVQPEFTLRRDGGVSFLTVVSHDGMNRLSGRKVNALCDQIEGLTGEDAPVLPLVISGNPIFSAGADLNEIAHLQAADALEFASLGQKLMSLVELYPAPVCAAIHGFCMGGGLDLALACHYRLAAPNAVFGHRGAALGLITGWGGTQRLPRLIGRARALEMFISAEKINARQALQIGLVDAVVEDPVGEAARRAKSAGTPNPPAL